jgi:hypothetical protein
MEVSVGWNASAPIWIAVASWLAQRSGRSSRCSRAGRSPVRSQQRRQIEEADLTSGSWQRPDMELPPRSPDQRIPGNVCGAGDRIGSWPKSRVRSCCSKTSPG